MIIRVLELPTEGTNNMATEGIDYDNLIIDGPKKADMSTNLNTDRILNAYEDVRSDGSETEWVVYKFVGANLDVAATGNGFEGFRSEFSEDDRAFGYIRIQTGDEMSKRAKFIFVTWVGQNVGIIKRAKMSTDKAIIKQIVKNFAVELHISSLTEIDINFFKDELARAGGANYGTGVRDL